MAWATTAIRKAAQRNSDASAVDTSEDDEALSLRMSCRDDFVERMGLLDRTGFEAETDGYTVHYQRSLSESIPEPQVPTGYTIRSLYESEVDAAVVLHRAAFGTEYMTVEGRRSWMATSDYDPALDLVAVAPDGALASYCFCNISRADNKLSGCEIGWTDPVATHPDHQGKGLATALLATGLALLSERGMEKARLGTWSENKAMRNSAEKAGFEVYAKTLFFNKKLSE